MQVELTDRAQELVERYLALGYESAEAVVEEALVRLVQVEEQRRKLTALIEEGLASGEAEGLVPADEVMAKARAIVDAAKRRESQGAA
ncbi:MAG: hypothetical protein IT303_03595 [Dehalococcoidia bacterium]|nr:hypothetical protein [Dehalococcoidia bacterium]